MISIVPRLKTDYIGFPKEDNRFHQFSQNGQPIISFILKSMTDYIDTDIIAIYIAIIK